MLSPVQFNAPETAAPAADSSYGGGDPAGRGGFAGAIAALSGEPAQRANPSAGGAPSPATGQALPRDGKELPNGGLPSESWPPDGLPPLTDRRGLPLELPTACKKSGELVASAPLPDRKGIQAGETLESPALPELPASLLAYPIALPVPGVIELSAKVGDPVVLTSAGTATMTDHPPRAAVPDASLPASAGSLVPLESAVEWPVGLRRYGQLSGAAATSTDTVKLRYAISDFAEHATSRQDAPDRRTLQQSAALTVPATVPRQVLPNLAASAALQPATLRADINDRGVTPAGATTPLQGGLLPATLAAAAGTLPPPAASEIRLPPGSAGWNDALGDRVLWMAGNKIQNAEIRLNPADLGPLRVQISVDDGTATINFHAHHSLTRDAIEQALPRLRDMLGDQGLSLGNTSVSGHDVKQQQSQAGRHGMAPAVPVDDDLIADIGAAVPVTAAAMPGVGLIDLFA